MMKYVLSAGLLASLFGSVGAAEPALASASGTAQVGVSSSAMPEMAATHALAGRSQVYGPYASKRGAEAKGLNEMRDRGAKGYSVYYKNGANETNGWYVSVVY